MTRSPTPILLVGLLAVAACDDGSAPAVDPPTHDLVFAGTLDAVPELLRFDAATWQVRRVLPPGTAADDPTPSPDGRVILFTWSDRYAQTGEIFATDPDGAAPVALTDAPQLDDQPTWSPDGARIAFRSYRLDRLGDIWVMDADGGEPVLLTPDPPNAATDEHHPAWSPDGARIAYVSTAGGTNDIWTMDPDGGDKRQLTDTGNLDTEPAWSPDGLTLAFRRSGEADPGDVALLPAGGGAATVLTLPGVQRAPAWSPDGTFLVFAHRPPGAVRWEIWRLRPDGSGLGPVVAGRVPGGSQEPAFLRREPAGVR